MEHVILKVIIIVIIDDSCNDSESSYRIKNLIGMGV